MQYILSNLRAVLETTPNRLVSLARATPEALLRRHPAPGEWSALETIQHLIDLERGVFPVRIRAILAGENFPAFFPEKDGSTLAEHVSPEELADLFAGLRVDNLHLLNDLTPEDMVKQAVHAELGPVTLAHLLHEWGGHDLMHLVQIEQALMQPFITGCGPWQVYFTEHVAKSKSA